LSNAKEEKTSIAEAKLYQVFTPGYTTFLVIMIYVSLFFAWATEATIGKDLKWFVPYIYFFLVFELLGRISPRFRLNPAQLIALLIPLTYAAGKAYISFGGIGENYYDLIGTGFYQYCVSSQLYSDAAKQAVLTLPSWLIPHNDLAIKVLRVGLQPGLSMPWDVWAGPIITWSLAYISMNVLNIGIGFLLTGPQWTETEKLLFPLSVPSVYTIEQVTTRDSSGKSRLFSSDLKVFWIFFVIGFILGGIPFATEILPPLAIFGSFYWGEVGVPFFAQVLNPLIPGADFSAVFIIMQAIIMVLLPYSVMISALVAFVALRIIYVPLMVRLGVIPYNPTWGDFNYGTTMPLPYRILVREALMPAFAIYLIWLMRGRIKQIWDALTKKDAYIGDLSIRQAAWITIASLVVLLGIWIAAGMPIIIALIIITIYLLYQIAAARFMNEIWWHQPVARPAWTLYFPVGAALGYWNWNPPNYNQSLMASNAAWCYLTNWGGPRQTIYSTPSSTLVYNMAARLKASIKSIYFWYIIVAVLGIPSAIVLRLFMEAHLGANNLAWAGVGAGDAMNEGILQVTDYIYTGFSWGANYILVILSMIFMWILLYLQRYSWMWWFNPAGFLLGIETPAWMWLSSTFALITKYLVYRIFGARKTEENLVPAAAGIGVGFGAPYLFAGLYVFFTRTLPTILTYWH